MKPEVPDTCFFAETLYKLFPILIRTLAEALSFSVPIPMPENPWFFYIAIFKAESLFQGNGKNVSG